MHVSSSKWDFLHEYAGKVDLPSTFLQYVPLHMFPICRFTICMYFANKFMFTNIAK